MREEAKHPVKVKKKKKVPLKEVKRLLVLCKKGRVCFVSSVLGFFLGGGGGGGSVVP